MNRKNLDKIFILLVIVSLIVVMIFMMGFNLLLKSLLIVIVIDYILGLSLGILGNSKYGDGKISSKVGFKSILKKLTILLLVGVSFLITMFLSEYNINFKHVVDSVITIFFINEVISILENAKRLGIDVPDFFSRSIGLIKTKEENTKK